MVQVSKQRASLEATAVGMERRARFLAVESTGLSAGL